MSYTIPFPPNTATLPFKPRVEIEEKRIESSKNSPFSGTLPVAIRKLAPIEVISTIVAEKKDYKRKLAQIKQIDFAAEAIDAPNERVFQNAESLIEKLQENNFYPNRICESAEGGLCFQFSKDSRILYFEIYNDGEKGYIIEDNLQKTIIKNRDVDSDEELFNELKEFFL